MPKTILFFDEQNIMNNETKLYSINTMKGENWVWL